MTRSRFIAGRGGGRPTSCAPCSPRSPPTPGSPTTPATTTRTTTRPRERADEALPAARGDERHPRTAGQGLVLGAGRRRHRRRALHPMRHLRRCLPVELDRRQHENGPTGAGEDVHRVLAVLGLLPPRRPALRG